MNFVREKTKNVLRYIGLYVFVAALFLGIAPHSFAASNVANRYDKMNTSYASTAAVHEVGFTYTEFGVPVGSVKLEFCSNSPIIGSACTPPSGFDLGSATLDNQTGETGFSIDAPNSTANIVVLTRPAAIPSAGQSTYTLGDVMNPDQMGTFYLRIQTFTSIDATGVNIQEGGVALSVSDQLVLSTFVPPHLEFCVAVVITSFDCSSANSYYVDMGEFSQTQAKGATTQMVASTNAISGYSVSIHGTTLTSGNIVIPSLALPTFSTPGTSQFGINLRANTQPSLGDDPSGPGTASPEPNYTIPNRYMYLPNDTIISSNSSQDFKKYTVTYVVNIGSNQPAGIYATTITYICLANF